MEGRKPTRRYGIRIGTFLLLAAALFFSPSRDFFGEIVELNGIPAGESVLSAGLRNELDRIPAGEPISVWVFFRDKGVSGDELDRSLVARTGQLSTRVLWRRSKTMGARIVVEGDLPVFQDYVTAVLGEGARLRHRSRWLNAISVEASPETIVRIATLPSVRRVQRVARLGRIEPLRSSREDVSFEESAAVPAGTHSLDYGPSFGQLDQINVPAVHDSGFSGDGVIVMMLDTGYYKDHESLSTLSILEEWDFVFEDGETQDEPDDVPGQHSHGTATWSALGGFSEGNLIGPAYGASFLLAKTEDLASETPAEEDNYVAALEWADTLGVDVASASLAYLIFDFPFPDYQYSDLDGNTAVISTAIDEAARRGILVCNAIANSGPGSGSLWTPSDSDSMIACGAVDPFGLIADFSSRGPTSDGRIKPEVVARGIDTWAASSGGGYGSYGGTSLSTPLVGGAAALVIEAHPEWGPMQVREALMATADRAATPDNAYGSGLIDVWSAIYEEGLDLTPIPFSLIHPAPGDSVSTSSISFEWSASIDPVGRNVDYKFELSEDSLFTDPLVIWDIPDNSFTLEDTLAEGLYFWKVYAYNDRSFYRESGEIFHFHALETVGVGNGEPGGPSVPQTFALGQNFPNPFNPVTTISFDLPEAVDRKDLRVLLTVHDVRGREIRVLFRGELPAGSYQFSWDGRDDTGRMMPSGVYLYRMSAGESASVRKMVLQK
jgi:hypothetical protein